MRQWPGYVISIAFVALATWLKYLAQPHIIPADVPILYIMAIVPTAIFFGLGPSILVCILSLLAYDYFFIPPLYQVSVVSVQEAPIVSIFLFVGIIISILSSNLRQKNRIASQEIITRKKAESELLNYKEHLEDLVKQRTSELENVNLALRQEIDERNRFEQALSQNELRWATTLASIGDGVIATDASAKITFMNSEAQKLTGWLYDDASGKPVTEVFNIVNEHSRQKADNPVDKVIEQGTVCSLANHTILIRRDGSEVAIDDSAAPIKYADGKTTGVVLIFRDISERKKSEEATRKYALELEKHRAHLEEMVKERTSELQSLSYRLIMVQEEERRNISRELHDQTGQSLTVLNMLLGRALRSPESASGALLEAQQTVKEVLSQVRNLSSSLHPGMLEDLGLLPTLNWYFNDFDKKTGILIHFKHTGLETALPPDVNIIVYRIIQEGLTNIARYAEVSEADVTITIDKKRLLINISDKGKGFDITSSSAGLGLRGMKERANSLSGDVKIASAQGAGTTIEVELSISGIKS